MADGNGHEPSPNQSREIQRSPIPHATKGKGKSLLSQPPYDSVGASNSNPNKYNEDSDSDAGPTHTIELLRKEISQLRNDHTVQRQKLKAALKTVENQVRATLLSIVS